MTKAPEKDPPGNRVIDPSGERRAASRTKLAFPVRCRYESVLDFVETQSMNISRSGMFIITDTPAPLDSRIDFDFSLVDGFTLLKGSADVMRVVTGGPINGMGVRFVDLDAANRNLIERIVAVNEEEGRNSTVKFDFSRPATAGSMPIANEGSVPVTDPILFEGRRLRLVLGPLTVHHFTQNPLLNVRSGGFFIPAHEDVPLGTVFQVEIVDGDGHAIVAGSGKVVVKQDLRVGIRLGDVDKDGMAHLRAEVARLAPSK
jgi:uncharacterized protein (TIGR02266 family)